MRVLLFDTDINGHASVLDLVQKGDVAAYPCAALTDVEGLYWALKGGQVAKPDLVVVDTVTNMANKAVLDASRPNGQHYVTQNLAALLPSQNEWGQSGYGSLHLLRPIFELPIPQIWIFHENLRDDPMSGVTKTSINVQRLVNNQVISWADAIVRLTTTTLPLQAPDGRIIPAGTRQLLLAPTPDSAVGVRTFKPIPPVLYDPVLEDFFNTLGYVPHLTLLYGPQKIGKTTFACNANRRVPTT